MRNAKAASLSYVGKMMCSGLISVFTLTATAQAQTICDQLDGAIIIAEDGKMLGTISSKYDDNSILNEYGDYGSEYSSNSIWNEYGDYGGEYSDKSPFNEYTSTPPIIVMNNKPIGYLSVTKKDSRTLHPMMLKTCE